MHAGMVCLYYLSRKSKKQEFKTFLSFFKHITFWCLNVGLNTNALYHFQPQVNTILHCKIQKSLLNKSKAAMLI